VHGYAYGGSGGGYRTIAGAENTDGVWDGFVPYVIGSPMAIPNVFSVRMHAQRVLRHRLDTIIDALEPGGSGDPYESLDAEEREALAEVTAMGFPPRAWFGHRAMGMHAFTALYGGMRLLDPGYFDDFWTLPGYLGAGASVHRDRLRHTSGISAVITAREAARLGLGMPQAADARGGVDDAFLGPAAEEGSVVGLRLAVTRPLRRAGHGAHRPDRAGRGEVRRPVRSAGRPGAAGRAARYVLSAWVEQGTPPAASTGCTITDGQVMVPSSVAVRRGVQPVVRLTVNGADRADVRPGEEVTLCAVGEVPPGAGKVVAVQWDLDGDGTFPATENVTPADRVRVERRHAFSSPGTRFVTVRVRSERDGDASALFTRVDNIARVRVGVARTDGPDAGRTS
jgi:hypothetical protein